MNQTLYYDRPAACFNEGLPLGNGSLGAMLFGNPLNERILLNHDTLWSGTHLKPCGQNKSSIYKKAQRLALEGRLAESEELLNSKFIGSETQYYLSAGALNVEFEGTPQAKNYCRKLDLKTAIHRVEYDDMKTSAFVSHPHNVFVYRFKSSSRFSCKISYKNYFNCHFSHQNNTVACLSQAPLQVNAGAKVEYIYQSGDDAGMPFAVAVCAATNGTVGALSTGLLVKNATEFILYASVQTGYNGFEQPFLTPQCVLKSAIQTVYAANDLGYSALAKAHTDDYSSFFNRVSVSLNSSNCEAMTTDYRLKRHAGGECDPGLYELLFNYGRYLLISSSRANSQAANLQGIWNPYKAAPWKSNYTININAQMNYWGVFQANLCELAEPLERLIKILSLTGKATAENYYGAPGFVAHHNTDIWGMSEPCGKSSIWAYFPGGSGWLCRHLFEKYHYLNNRDYLKNTAWPIMRSAAEFYAALLIENSNGKLIFCPATSPENNFKLQEDKLSVAESTAMMQSIIYDLFHSCIKTCTLLHTDMAFCAELKNKLERLQLPQIGQDGAILEWNENFCQTDLNHRHLSHLYALYPAELPVFQQNANYLKAAEKALKMRGMGGTGWSLSWKLNLWAILHNGNAAQKLMDLQLRPVCDQTVQDTSGGISLDGGSYPNLLSAHPPFQIDGNLGYISGFCNLFLQSDDRGIYLLPALPDAFANGSICGLRAKGNVTVDLLWRQHQLVSYKIHGENGLPVYYKGQRL